VSREPALPATVWLLPPAPSPVPFGSSLRSRGIACYRTTLHLTNIRADMAQISLVDSGRLSALLKEAMSWNDSISSILVSAQNGSILAYAFRQHTPSVKAMRTRSTTMTTAYAIARQDTLVFEAQRTGALTVVSALADQILLSVTGPEPQDVDPYEKTVHEAAQNDTDGAAMESSHEQDPEMARLRSELETVNQELVDMIRDDLAEMKWPEDI